MTSFREIIDAFGVSRLASILGLGESHVRVMKVRNSVPPEYWERMISHRPRPLLENLDTAALLQIRNSRFKQRNDDRAEQAITQ